MAQEGYVNYFEILGLDETAKPGEVRKNYKQMMKDLVMEIARVEITEERRGHYLLEMAKLNAAFYILRDTAGREAYWNARQELIRLEEEWIQSAEAGGRAEAGGGAEAGTTETDSLRRSYDMRIRHFLSRYIEEAMLEAGRDKECVETSNWDPAHERHASRILRHYRQSLYQQLLARLPFSEVTRPDIDWTERAQTVRAMLAKGGC